jgi:hypothetical protein
MRTMVERIRQLSIDVNLNLLSSEDLALVLAEQIDQMMAETRCQIRGEAQKLKRTALISFSAAVDCIPTVSREEATASAEFFGGVPSGLALALAPQDPVLIECQAPVADETPPSPSRGIVFDYREPKSK